MKIQLHNLVQHTQINIADSSVIRDESHVNTSGMHTRKFSPSPEKGYFADSRLTVGAFSVAQTNNNFYKEKNEFLEEELEIQKNKNQLL